MKFRERFSLLVLVTAGAPLYLFARGLTGILRLVRWHRWLPRLQSMLRVRNRVLYLEVFFPEASGYIYRVTNWTNVLESQGLATTVRHAVSKATTDRLLGRGWTGLFFTVYMARRLLQCLMAPFYNLVIVRRELLLFNDYGDLFMEQLLLSLNPAVVLDFDDDLGAAKQEPRSISGVGRVLRESPVKFGRCLELYPYFIAGSGYLKQMVLDRRGVEACERVVVIPTCVSYAHHMAKSYSELNGAVTFGWIGTDGNLRQLEQILTDLEEVSRRSALRLLVISGQGLTATASFAIENRRWSLESEIPDLLEIDVGLMPLTDTAEERGKCGFKLIQYMGLGIVSVASAVTTNCEIVTDGVDGFLVKPGAEWAPVLERVIARRDDFAEIGSAARARIQSAYSVEAHATAYVRFVSRCMAPPWERGG